MDPADPDVAVVGALGNLWAPSEDRGVFRTEDGGRTWRKVLYVDDVTGIVDLARDGGDDTSPPACVTNRATEFEA